MAYLAWIGGGLVGLAVLAYGGFLIYGQLIERPDYRVTHSDGAFELRTYPDLVVAEVTTTGSRQAAVSAGFSPLARYIFASDRAGEKIAMTAPVTQTRSEDGWKIRFIMPKGYKIDDLPHPTNAKVTVLKEVAGQYAAVRFSGRPGDADFAMREDSLRDWIAAQGLSAEGAPVLAYYNDPMTPGPIRRNEVMMRITD